MYVKMDSAQAHMQKRLYGPLMSRACCPFFGEKWAMHRSLMFQA